MAIAVLTTVGVWAVVNGLRREVGTDGRATVDQPAPPITGTTLDGATFDLASLRGRPVVLNFWGPSCVPCRNEFPLFLRELDVRATDGLAIVGILTDDPPEPAREFIAEYRASWPTVIDPNESIKSAYGVIGRPFTWFVDRTGVLRARQIGEMTDEDFARHFETIR